jgi:PPOX class probable F420-dependent enzyme
VDDWVRAALATASHGVLVTIGPDGEPRPVPFTYALVDDRIVGAVDHKPKTTTRLARLADIERHGRASVLVEHYDDDWRRLWWVRISGPAAVQDPGDGTAVDALVAKYGQYRERRPSGPTYAVTIAQVRAWRATEAPS